MPEVMFSGYQFDPSWADNPAILAWWTGQHDTLLASLIDQYAWTWPSYARDAIVAITPANVLDQWRLRDPTVFDERKTPGGRAGLPGRITVNAVPDPETGDVDFVVTEKQPSAYGWVWYNVLMYFALARAHQLGLLSRSRTPKVLRCVSCGEEFREDSLRLSYIRRLTLDQIDFCGPCLDATIWSPPDRQATREEIIAYLQDMARAIGQPPRQGYGTQQDDLLGKDTATRSRILALLWRKPAIERVKELFGTHKEALRQAGLTG